MIIALRNNQIVEYAKDTDSFRNDFDPEGCRFYDVTTNKPRELMVVPLTCAVFLYCGNNVTMKLGEGGNYTSALERLGKFLKLKGRVLTEGKHLIDDAGGRYIIKTIKWKLI